MNLILPQRTQKPRNNGITSIHDVGIPLKELESILFSYSDYLDIAKFGVGSAIVEPRLKEKINLYKSFSVIPYFGGTLFEKFYFNNKLDEFIELLNENDIKTIEISTGTIDISLEERLKLVSKYKNEFTVIAEVGSKDGEKTMSPREWIDEIKQFIEAGTRYVITEGRNSESSGIFHSSGALRKDLIAEITEAIDIENLIFEAPSNKTQMYFIKSFGANINFGNVNPRDLLLLESQRQGLRSETFYL